MNALRLGCVALALTLVSGCYTTSFRSGLPAATQDGKKRWHNGVLSGGQELSGPYDLKQVCPDGWSEIRTKTTPLQTVIEFGSMHTYSPQTVEILCAEKPEAQAAGSATAAR